MTLVPTKLTLVNAKRAPVAKRSRMETMLLNVETLKSWTPAPFQRPLRINSKVLGLAEDIKSDGGIVPGVITLGTIGERKDHYIIDGQHRLEAAKISGLEEFIADVRLCSFDSLADMGAEFVNLNSRLVNMRPDDILRGLEGSVAILGVIRKNCEFVGYANIRRNEVTSAVLGMSIALRFWHGAGMPTPSLSSLSAVDLAKAMDTSDAMQLCQFLNVARSAWGNDLVYARLWGGLNLTMCAWLWRNIVTPKEDKSSQKRATFLNASQFQKCLMSLSASSDYLDWLMGRRMVERDRSPCYSRIKRLLTARLREEGFEEKKIKFPLPSWATS